MQSQWSLHFESYVISDGEPHRSVGDEFDWFAIAFWTQEPLTGSEQTVRSAVLADD